MQPSNRFDLVASCAGADYRPQWRDDARSVKGAAVPALLQRGILGSAEGGRLQDMARDVATAP